MSPRDTTITALTALLFTPVLLLSLNMVFAQAMQSTNYRIQSDSVNFGGGLSTSTSYTLESTAGEVATGDTVSASYNLRAGYQQMTGSTISMSTPDPVTMTPSIPGISGGVANGSTTVTVTTDSFGGYELTIKASQSPALVKDSDSIADYVPGTSNPDYTFTTDANDAHFGYSPSGVNVVARFKDDGGVCNINTQETALACWDGLSTTDVPISRSAGGNSPNGATTTVYFRVGIGGSVVQTGGTYTATTTLTALAL